MIKGKNGFWLLTIIFSFIIIFTVMSPYDGEVKPENSDTMGFMMKKDHAANISINQLFLANRLYHRQQNSNSSHSHPLPAFITSMSLFSTSIILVLLPLIIGSAVVMIILWM